jgi:hypothetical protein
MDGMNVEGFKELLAQSQRPCVSIIMPTAPMGADIRQDTIKLKDMVRQAESQMVATGVRDTIAKDILEPANGLMNDPVFWEHGEKGVALYFAPGFFRYYYLPNDVEEMVAVSERFNLKPLVSLAAASGQYYILAVSKHQVRVLEATRTSVRELHLPDMPQCMADALKTDNPEQQLQWHTNSPPPGPRGERAAIFHGQGVAVDNKKDELLRFFRKIDKSLHALLHDKQTPLVLAGVDYYLPIYAEANTYKYLMPDAVKGNPEGLDDKELRHQAWNIVQSFFRKEEQASRERYDQLAGTNSVTRDLNEVISGAVFGRVDTLFLAREQERWGTFDADKNLVLIHESKRPGDQDLLDYAAAQTIMHGGRVYVVDPDKMPGKVQPAVAILRF